MKTQFPSFKYKGFQYKPWEEIEHDANGVPENRKIFHTVEHSDGIIKLNDKEIDWSPYRLITLEGFKLWIDLGCPDRYDEAFGSRKMFFPIDRIDLQTIHNYRFSTPESRGINEV